MVAKKPDAVEIASTPLQSPPGSTSPVGSPGTPAAAKTTTSGVAGHVGQSRLPISSLTRLLNELSNSSDGDDSLHIVIDKPAADFQVGFDQEPSKTVIGGFDTKVGSGFDARPDVPSPDRDTPQPNTLGRSYGSFVNNSAFVNQQFKPPASPRINRTNSVSHTSFYASGGYGSESLSSSIPYSAPGGRGQKAVPIPVSNLSNALAESKLGSLADSASHIPNLPNGQPISSIQIQSPNVGLAAIEPRFVISKQRVAQAQAASLSSSAQRLGSQSGLSFFFLGKTKSKRDSSSTDLGSFYNNSYQELPSAAIALSPSSLSSTDSTNSYSQSRHNSMANLKRFFKNKPPSSQPIPVSNLLSSLRSNGLVATSLGSNLTTLPSNASISHSPNVPTLSNSTISRSSSQIRSSFSERRGSVSALVNMQLQLPFTKRYSKFGESLGAGAGGSVKLVTRLADKKIFAVKEFRAKYQNETKRDYAKKITGEYCIGSTLKHPNIIETVEICYENERILQVMEYCDFDLFAIVMLNKMSREEINCCFKQILLGLHYLHSMGLAHRDLKLDNCVIDARGIVKIIDFGSAVIFSYPFTKLLIEAQGIVGSDPYLAPEVCVFNKYDPRPVDVWLAAIIYCCMMLKKFPWKVPKLLDSSFKMFATRGDNTPLSEMLKRTPQDGPLSVTDVKEALPEVPDPEGKPHTSTDTGSGRLLLALPEDCRPLVSKMVELAPACRITIEECFNDEWLTSIKMCTVEERILSDGSVDYQVFKLDDHEHTTVDQLKAHIAAFDKNKKK